MGIGGQRPKPSGQTRRDRPVVGWFGVENIPNDAGPRLPAQRRNGQPWPDALSMTQARHNSH